MDPLKSNLNLRTWSLDPQTGVVRWSVGVYEFFGIDDARPAPSWEEHRTLFPPASFRILTASVARCTATGEAFVLNLEAIHSTGKAIFAEMHGGSVRDAAGRTTEICGVIIDRTEQVRATQALRLSNEQFAAAFNFASIGMALVSLEGPWLRVNSALCRMLGYSEDELMKMTFQEVTHPDDLEADLAQVRRLIAGEVPNFTMEKRYIHKDRSVVWINLSVTLAKNDHGQPLYFISQIENITETRRNKEELVRRNALLEAIVHSSPDGILVVSSAGRKVIQNTRVNELWGIPPEIANDPDDTVQARWAADQVIDHESFAAKLKELYGNRDAESLDEVALKSGRILNRYSSPIISPNGIYYGRVWIFRDVTGERQKLREIEEAREQALAADRAKSEFLGVMSHELRTPLNGIQGYAELILNTHGLPPETYEYSRIIHSSGQALVRLLQDILDFSRLESGRVELSVEPFSVSQLVWDVVTLLERSIPSKNVVVEVKIDGDVPPTVNGDPGRIRQVLLNVVGNALKFTTSGSVWIGVHPGADTAKGQLIHFEVEDTGPGIPESMRESVFLPFTQADASSSRRHGGVGLGLSIAARLVDQMGGKLSYRPRDPHGSIFSFAITMPHGPLADSDDVGELLADETLDAGFAARHPLRILIAEDDPVNEKLMLRMLARLGYTDVLTARNGREAVDLTLSASPDLVFMDLQMPEMDGLTACQRIREAEAASASPPCFISALTANSSPADRSRCFATGMDRYMSKPVNTRMLAESAALATVRRKR